MIRIDDMCAILGVLGLIDEKILDRLQILSHRGPDQEGVRHLEAFPASLAHKRLSILGIEEGLQPVVDEQGRALVFNGEIYNCLELQAKYELRETSRSDTLILFELLCRFNEKILPELRGMFSFCFVDSKNQRAILARDPFGMKPLFFRFENNVLEFSSEVRSFQSQSNLAQDSVLQYLYCMHPAPGRTLFYGVEELLPGECLKFENSQFQRHFYFKLSEVLRSNQKLEIGVSLKKSVQRHLLSDVPVGLLLSSGVDSGSLLLTLHDLNQQISSFSLGFNQSEFDESSYAQYLSESLTFPFERIHFQELNLERLEQILQSMDAPFADPSYIPTYMLCEGVSRTHKVVLGGDGGDEIFFGYPTFTAHGIMSRFPTLLQNWLRYISSQIGKTSQGRIGLREKLYRLSFPNTEQSLEQHQAYMGTSHPRNFDPQVRKSMLEALLKQALLEGIDPDDLWELVFYFYFRFYLASQVLVKSDRASMAHSLELRCPYLDVDFAKECFQRPNARFPFFQKPKQSLKDYYLKAIKERRLKPASLKKRGFSTPLSVVLPMLEELILQRHGLDLSSYRSSYAKWPHFAYSSLVFLYFYPEEAVLRELKKHTD